MKKMFLTLFLIVSMTYSCGDDNPGKIIEKPQETTYANPVYPSSMPDPTIIKGDLCKISSSSSRAKFNFTFLFF